MTTSDGTAPFRPAARQALTAAMKARDSVAVGALRAVIAAIDNAEAADPAHAPAQQPGPIAGGVKGLGAGEVPRRTLGDAEVRAIVEREMAERQDAAAQYDELRRPDAAARLRAEIEVLRPLLDGA